MHSRTTIERTQHGVGQGGFHTCSIRRRGSYSRGDYHKKTTYEYVFDCGTRSVGPGNKPLKDFLSQHIGNYRPANNIVDALFISHLDIDHYNGAQMLCGAKSVSRIFLPYFTVDQIVFLIADQASNDVVLAPDYINDLLAIAAGARRLFGVPVTVVGGDESPENLDPPPPAQERDERLQPVVIREDGQAQPLSGNLPSGTDIALRSSLEQLPWVLRPWSYKQSSAALLAMSSAIDKIPALKDIQTHTGTVSGTHIDALNEKANKTAIRKACRTIIKDAKGTYASNHNTPSLSLYSGPPGHDRSNYTFSYSERGVINRSLDRDPVGWITTGDCLMNNHWADFRACFADVLTHVGTYVLPHHGSVNNHSQEFIDAIPGQLALICARHGSEDHPSKTVLNCLYEVDDHIQIVNEYSTRGVKEIVSFHHLDD